MTNIEPKDQKQQGKHIRYMLPVELELWGFPGNVLLFNKKGLLMPYTVTEKEQKDIEECVKKEHTSFDEELKKRFETFFNNTEINLKETSCSKGLSQQIQ